MNAELEVKADKVKNSQEEEVIPQEGKSYQEAQKAAAKSPEKMTKTELLEKIKELQEASEKNYDLYLRSEAELENIKKRNKKEKEEWFKYANETLIKEMLSVIDNLELAISHAQNEYSIQALREGVELTLKGLKDTLARSGLEEVGAEGEPFDPNYHHAVSEQNDENAEAGIILQELQRGYTLNGRLIRPSMVIVSKGKGDERTEQSKFSE